MRTHWSWTRTHWAGSDGPLYPVRRGSAGGLQVGERPAVGRVALYPDVLVPDGRLITAAHRAVLDFVDRIAARADTWA